MCTRPLTAHPNPEGGRPIFGWQGQKEGLTELKLPCGKCPECQKDYYTNWATRGYYELKKWQSSIFITLTYSEENLPKDKSLSKCEVQRFIKRVKKHFGSCRSNPIRQTYCGEYGSITQRPHYHVILYNCEFSDKRPHRKSETGHDIFTSATLQKLWPYGFSEFGYATPASVAYIYKYILKKKTRKEKKQPLVIEVDGFTYEVAHEFVESSRNPGIGAHLKESESIKKGYLSVDGVRKKLPKYYLEHLKKADPVIAEQLADKRFDFQANLPKESALRREQKEKAQKLFTSIKKRL